MLGLRYAWNFDSDWSTEGKSCVPVKANVLWLMSRATLLSMEWAQAKGQNLSEHEVQRRLRGGIAFLLLALVCVILLERADASWAMRLLLFVPFYFATNAFFSAVHRTCGLSAIRGERNTLEGIEKIADPAERQDCLCVGKRQLVQSFIGSAIVTALFVFIG